MSGRSASCCSRKAIAFGATRDEAMAKLDRALGETAILGVHTSIPNLRA